MAKVFVTGISGFVGRHLARALVDAGHTVIGSGRDLTVPKELMEFVADYYTCDLTVPDQVSQLDLSGIDAVINLAGLAQVAASFGNEDLYHKVNVLAHTNLADAIVQSGNHSIRIVSISSGAVYAPDQAPPLREDSKLASNGSPYALSKIAMEQAMLPYQDKGLDVIIARPFNHIGPGQGVGFILPDLVGQILTAPSGGTITTGNLATKRDYTDVRDVVRAYALLATTEKLQHSIYNICTGESHQGSELLSLAMKAAHREDLATAEDPTRLRPKGADVMDLYGSHAALSEDTNWQPSISLDQTIQDFVSWATSQTKA